MKRYILPLAGAFCLLFVALAAAAANGGQDMLAVPPSEGPSLPPAVTATPEPEGPTLAKIRTVTFSDVDPMSREADCVSYAAYTGLLQGVDRENFGGEDRVTRTTVAAVLHRMSGQEAPVYDGAFSDVDSRDWSAPAIAWAADAGIITGTDDGCFLPDALVSREELAAILYRFAAEEGAGRTGELSGYTDGSAVSEWARIPLEWVLENRLYAGMVGNTIYPRLPVSRNQLAQVLVALTAYLDGEPLAAELTTDLRAEEAVTLGRETHMLIQAAVEAAAKRYGAVGLQVAVVHRGQVADTFNYGWAVKNTLPMESDVKIRIASISKVSVAMGAMLLWEQGVIDPYESIGTYWGETVRNPSYKDKPVTVENILTHTSSIRLFGDDTSLKYSAVKAKLTSGGGFAQVPPGSMNAWGYNNYAFGVLGMTLELAAGRYLDEVLQEGLWTPMDIDAAFESGCIQATDRLATLYRHDGSVGRSAEKAARMVRPDTPAGLGSSFAGGLTISAQDQAKLTALLINDGVYQGVRLLSRESVAFMESPAGYVSSGGFYQCHPLRCQEGMYGREKLYYHTGSAYGVYNLMTYDPKTGDGVVVLTTGASAAKDQAGVYAVGGCISQAVYDLLGGQDYILISESGGTSRYEIAGDGDGEDYVLVSRVEPPKPEKDKAETPAPSQSPQPGTPESPTPGPAETAPAQDDTSSGSPQAAPDEGAGE